MSCYFDFSCSLEVLCFCLCSWSRSHTSSLYYLTSGVVYVLRRCSETISDLFCVHLLHAPASSYGKILKLICSLWMDPGISMVKCWQPLLCFLKCDARAQVCSFLFNILASFLCVLSCCLPKLVLSAAIRSTQEMDQKVRVGVLNETYRVLELPIDQLEEFMGKMFSLAHLWDFWWCLTCN